MNEDLCGQVATRVMGWTEHSVEDTDVVMWLEEREGFVNLQWTGYLSEILPGFSGDIHTRTDDGGVLSVSDYQSDVWKPDESIKNAWKMEAVIQERGLVERYVGALIDVLGLDMQPFNSAIELDWWEGPKVPDNSFEYDGYAYLWLLLRASPEDRCRAALLAVKDDNDAE